MADSPTLSPNQTLSESSPSTCFAPITPPARPPTTSSSSSRSSARRRSTTKASSNTPPAGLNINFVVSLTSRNPRAATKRKYQEEEEDEDDAEHSIASSRSETPSSPMENNSKRSRSGDKNRAAQKAFRERKQMKIKDLEQRSDLLTTIQTKVKSTEQYRMHLLSRLHSLLTSAPPTPTTDRERTDSGYVELSCDSESRSDRINALVGTCEKILDEQDGPRKMLVDVKRWMAANAEMRERLGRLWADMMLHAATANVNGGGGASLMMMAEGCDGGDVAAGDEGQK
ncbi:hypothetical protein HDU97_008880 [Phlyctochytrium planicorne]|nr:hypothetical protein HDU97_008880 [Phlyctochytrium planicorne]